MPYLYPGIKPSIGGGRLCAVLLTALFFPFFAFSQPVITGLSPSSGPVGSSFTINGSNFGATPSANIVFIGSVQAAVTAASATSLSVTVPPGTSFQPVTVTTGGLTAASPAPFITTFPDSGQFVPTAFASRVDIPTGTGPQSIFSMDFDGDGLTDLVVADGDSNTVEVYKNMSKPGTVSFKLAVDYLLPAGYYPVAVTAGDLDGDGKPDIVVSCYGSPKLTIFRNTSTTGSISLAAPVYYALGNYTTGVKIGDCNGDGKPEIVVASAADNVVSVYANKSTTGTISFAPKMDLTLAAGALPFNVIIADIDGDGQPDLASVNNGTNTVSVFRNTTPGSGTLRFKANVDFAVGNTPQDLAVGDLDGDGKPDLAVINNGDATVSILHNTSTTGKISFTKGTDVPTGTSTAGSPWAVVMNDLDGDGKPDIAVVNQLDNTVSVHRNTSTSGTPSIAAHVDYATGSVPWAITSADFDNDGMPDLGVIDNTSANITLLRNKSSVAAAILSFTPMAGPSGTVVTITGTNLTGATAVSFGGVAAASFTVNSSTSITATVGSGATGLVSVVTPAGTASLGTFTYGVIAPVVSSFTPTSGSTGTTITINGSHFTGATGVSFGGLAATSFTIVSDSVITAVVGNGSSGSVMVKAGSVSGQLAGFTFVPPSVSILSFSPTSGPQGTQVFVHGHGFLQAQSVSFGGVPASSITINGDTSLIAVVAGGATGYVAVRSSSSVDSVPGFTYVNNPPPPSNNITITGFTPVTGRNGDTIHITGTKLTTATSVNFGGTPALAFKAISDSQMIAVVGAGSTGAVRVANSVSVDSMVLFTYTYDSTKLSQPAFQLIQFTGYINKNNDPQLQWQVVNDAGIAYYAVERSGDSITFNVIGTVKSTRTNGASHVYSYTDASPLSGANWYRIRMQDTTAAYSYSSTIKLQPVSSGMQIYPNPVKYGFFLLNPPDISTASQVLVYEMSGKQLQATMVAAGTSQVRVNLPALATGMYRVMWTNGRHTVWATILVLQP